MERPESRYVKRVDGLSIGYQIFGKGTPGEHELKSVPDRWHLYRVVG